MPTRRNRNEGRGARRDAHRRRWIASTVFLLSALAVARTAVASGGAVLLKTDDTNEGFYYGLGGATTGRFITEYRLGDADPTAVICGARVFEVTTGAATYSGVMGYEIRSEDPAAPGYPDLTPGGLVANADPGSLSPCFTTIVAPRRVTFGGGAGLQWPRSNHYLCAVEPPRGNGQLDFCGVMLDTSSAPQGASKVFSGGAFGALPWNHFLEEEVAASSTAVLRVRYHGNRRFPADPGATVLYATRENAAATTTDDRLCLSFSIDNNTPLPLSINFEFTANLTGIVPGAGIVPLTSRFRPTLGGGPIVNPVTVPPGRTIYRLRIPGPLPPRATMLAPLNIPFSLRAMDAVSGNDYAFVTQVMGLRATPGEPDDGEPEAYALTRSPSASGDAMSVLFAGIDLPRSVPYAVTGVQVVGAEFGGSMLPGFDAVEVRNADPLLEGTPDLSPLGLLAAVGSRDGVGEIAMGPAPWFRALDIPDFTVDPTATPSSPPDLHAQVLLLPGTTTTFGALVGADRSPGRTVLGSSYFSLGSAVPYVRESASNFMIRLLIGGRLSTLPEEGGPIGGEAPPIAVVAGRPIPIDRFGNLVTGE